MRREGSKHGRIQAYGDPITARFKYPKLRHVRGVRGSNDCIYVLCPKRTNHSFQTGKCGTPRCWHCHLSPVNKSRGKTEGERKRKAQSFRTYYSTDWVIPVRKDGTNLSRGKDHDYYDCEYHKEEDKDESEEDSVIWTEEYSGKWEKREAKHSEIRDSEDESGEVESRLNPWESLSESGESSAEDEDWECLTDWGSVSDGCWELVDVM